MKKKSKKAKKAKGKLFKDLKPGDCFIQEDNIYCTIAGISPWALNLKTGEIISAFLLSNRVFPIKLDLTAVFPDKKPIKLPYF